MLTASETQIKLLLIKAILKRKRLARAISRNSSLPIYGYSQSEVCFSCETLSPKIRAKRYITIIMSTISQIPIANYSFLSFPVFRFLDIAPSTNIGPKTLTNWNYKKATPFWCWKNAMMDGLLAPHSERATLALFPATTSSASERHATPLTAEKRMSERKLMPKNSSNL